MEMCPHCKKPTLIDTHTVSKKRRALTYLFVEISVLCAAVFIWSLTDSKFITVVGAAFVMLGTLYLSTDKKSDKLFTCTSCENEFDREVVNQCHRCK